MPKIIDTEVIEQAKRLKLEGKSNLEISQSTGVSIGWCKKHLSENNLGVKEKYDKMYSKSKSKEGLSKAEIAAELDLYSLPAHEFSTKMQQTVRRVRANSKENIVRPNWMHPNFASFVTHRTIESAMSLEERSHEDASELHWLMTQECDEDMMKLMPSINQIKAAMMGIASATVSQRNDATSKLNSWLQSLHNTSTTLSKRNTQADSVEYASKAYPDDSIEDLEPLCY